ncbi:hypothetical protein DUNSADRAFT_10076, partial [Dunaliella salina]
VEDAEAAAAAPGELTEYQKFLNSLRTMEDGDGAGLAFGDYNEDDEDDEEFVLSYQELLGMTGMGPWDGQ